MNQVVRNCVGVHLRPRPHFWYRLNERYGIPVFSAAELDFLHTAIVSGELQPLELKHDIALGELRTFAYFRGLYPEFRSNEREIVYLLADPTTGLLVSASDPERVQQKIKSDRFQRTYDAGLHRNKKKLRSYERSQHRRQS